MTSKMYAAKQIFKENNWSLVGCIQSHSRTSSIHYGIINMPINNIKMVALKVMNAHKHPEQTEHELTSVRKLIGHRNDHVVRLIDTFDTVYHVSVAMEYCSKGDLYNYIKQVLHCPLSETQARQFFHQTCLGVEFLHSMTIAHLDIKPENLLLDENFNVRIGDFDMSRTTLRPIRKGCGTVGFAPPEAYSTFPFWGKPADIWSLGITVYSMVYGYTPFPDASGSIPDADYPPSFPGPRHPLLRNLVLSMIKLDPTRRPTIASVLDDLWFKAGGDSVAPPRGTGTHSGPRKETTNIPTPKYSKYSPEPSRKQRQASGVSITSILDFLDDTTNPPPKKDSTTPDYLDALPAKDTGGVDTLTDGSDSVGSLSSLLAITPREPDSDKPNTTPPRNRAATINSLLTTSPRDPSNRKMKTTLAENMEPNTSARSDSVGSLTSLLAITPRDPDKSKPPKVPEPNTNSRPAGSGSLSMASLLALEDSILGAASTSPNTSARSDSGGSLTSLLEISPRDPDKSNDISRPAGSGSLSIASLLALEDSILGTANDIVPELKETAGTTTGEIHTSHATPSPRLSPTPSPRLRPTPSPRLHPTPSPRLCPSPSPSPKLCPSPTPSPRLHPTPSPRLRPTPSPRLSPTPSPRLCPTPSPRLCPSPSPSPKLCPSPTPSPRLRSIPSLRVSLTTLHSCGRGDGPPSEDSWDSVSIHLPPTPGNQVQKKKSIWKRIRGFLQSCLPIKKKGHAVDGQ